MMTRINRRTSTNSTLPMKAMNHVWEVSSSMSRSVPGPMLMVVTMVSGSIENTRGEEKGP